MYCICSIYTFMYSIFISNTIKMYETLTFSFWYSSNRTVVVLLHKHFNSRLSASCNSVSIIRNCMCTIVSESNTQLFQVGLLRLISVQY